MTRIPFALPDIGTDEIDAVARCMASGWLTTGPTVKAFEESFAARLGATEAIAVSSATNASLILMDALGVGKGTEVIVSAYTFSGPAMMAGKRGATSRGTDCIPGSYQVDPVSVKALINERTIAVMPTHFGGASCDMKSLKTICDAAGIFLIDDAAHAFPTYDMTTLNLVGSGKDSDATFFSFYATKTLTTGEGGMITTNSPHIAGRVRKFRSHGFDKQMFDRYTNVKTGWKYDIAAPGWKANMTDMQATIGLVQLARTSEMHMKRRLLAEQYNRELAALVPGIKLPVPDNGNAWHLYPIQVFERDRFVAEMGELGVQCSVHFIPLTMHSYWRGVLSKKNTAPNAEFMHTYECSLPLYSKMTGNDVSTVVAALTRVLGNR